MDEKRSIREKGSLDNTKLELDSLKRKSLEEKMIRNYALFVKRKAIMHKTCLKKASQ